MQQYVDEHVAPVWGTPCKLSISTSHERVEMLVDPAINLMTTGPDPKTI